MSDNSRAIVPVVQRGVVVSVTRQITITEKLLKRIQSVHSLPAPAVYVPQNGGNEFPIQNKRDLKLDQTTTTEWLNKSFELQDKGDWPGLITHTIRWTQAQPEYFYAWNLLGKAYYNTKQYAKAIEAFQQVIQINPKYADAWNNLGNACVADNTWHLENDSDKRLEQLANAIEAYQQAIRINPDFPASLLQLGNTNSDTAQYIKAIKAYQEAIRINPEHTSTWFNLGIAYKLNGQTDKVMEVYRQLETLNSDSANKFFNKFVMP